MSSKVKRLASAKIFDGSPRVAAVAACLACLAVSSCTTAEVVPQAPPPVAPPPYVQVPHPVGYDLGDLRAVFTERGVPKSDELKDCDADLKKLKTLTQSNDELAQGARELVKLDPIKYHWCYYGRILQLEDELKDEAFLHERQKKVLEAYSFLAPLGRAFMQEFRDSRYMRWGVRHYQRLSEWVFYRKLETTPQATSELVEAANPFGLVREPAGAKPVLEKYNIVPPPAPVASIAPAVPTAPAAASEAPAPPLAATSGITPPALPALEPVAAPAPDSASAPLPDQATAPSPVPAPVSVPAPPAVTEAVAPSKGDRAPAASKPEPAPAPVPALPPNTEAAALEAILRGTAPAPAPAAKSEK